MRIKRQHYLRPTKRKGKRRKGEKASSLSDAWNNAGILLIRLSLANKAGCTARAFLLFTVLDMQTKIPKGEL
jgi:hypothetical protein